MKATVLYHSESGNTRAAAEKIVSGMTSEGVEAKAMSITEVDEAWIKDSSCIIVGSPVYNADVSAQVKKFMEGIGKFGVAGKLGGAFATANFVHGGGEIAIQTILTHMMVSGMVVYSGGGACGMPVIHLGPVSINQFADELAEYFVIYGQRMAKKVKELFK